MTTDRIKALEDALTAALSAWDEHNERGHYMQGDWVYDARAAIAASRAAPDCQQQDLVTAARVRTLVDAARGLLFAHDHGNGLDGWHNTRERLRDALRAIGGDA